MDLMLVKLIWIELLIFWFYLTQFISMQIKVGFQLVKLIDYIGFVSTVGNFIHFYLFNSKIWYKWTKSRWDCEGISEGKGAQSNK